MGNWKLIKKGNPYDLNDNQPESKRRDSRDRLNIPMDKAMAEVKRKIGEMLAEINSGVDKVDYPE